MDRYDEPLEAAREYLRLALHRMVKLGVHPNPINYAVFYEYASGRNAALALALDESIDKGSAFTNDLGLVLYRQHIAEHDPDRLEELQDQLRRIVADSLDDLAAADVELSRYGESMKGDVGRLESGLQTADILEVVKGVIRQTESLLDTNKALQSQLSDSRQKTVVLGQELEKVREQAVTDTLTGLANRQALAQAFEAAVTATDAGETCLLMVDIDHFKRVNDTHGHVVGDGVLSLTAEALLGCCKGRDTVARYGGEEFSILLPQTPYKGALVLAERIRTHVAGLHMVKTGSKESIGNITVSVGVARHRAGESLTDLVDRADRALYAAKDAGRNRVAGETGD